MSVADRQSPGALDGPGIDAADPGADGDRQANAHSSVTAPLVALVAALAARLRGVALGVFDFLAPEPEEARAHTKRTYTTVAENSIAQYAMGLLIALIVLLVAILVGGQFAASVPSDNPFSSAMQTTIDTAGTAFEIFGVTLIILPGVAAVALILKGLGGVAGMGGGR